MRPSRLLPALAAILIATAPVEAEDSGQGLLLPFGGAPSWVLKPPGGPAPTIDMNFATGQYYGLQPSQLSVTRASPDNEVCNGKLYQFATNVAPITPCGLYVWEARTNATVNNSLTGASVGNFPTGWATFLGGGVTASVVATGTENSIGYIDVQVSGTPTATGQQLIQIGGSNDVAVQYGQTYTISAFLKLSNGSLTNITGISFLSSIYTSVPAYAGAGPSTGVLTPNGTPLGLQRSAGSATLLPATGANLRQFFVFTSTNGQAINATFRIALPQLELNPNLLASVASATVAGGGAAYVGASGTMTWSGAGCTTNPVLNVTTSAGAINAVTSVATPGSCTTFPVAGATTWTPGGGLSVGTGASFNLVPTDNSAQAFATGPILTSGTAVTRAANSLITASPISHNAASFSVAIQGTPFGATATFPTWGSLETSNFSQQYGIVFSNTNTLYAASSSPTATFGATSVSLNSKAELAATFNAPTFLSSINGASSSGASVAGTQVSSANMIVINGNCDCSIQRLSIFGVSGLSQSALNYVTSH